jgi:SnoaL-like domain
MHQLAIRIVCLVLVLLLAVPSPTAAQSSDPVAVIESLDTALNAHDRDAALALFADDAVVKDGDPALGASGNFVGTDQIRSWIAAIVDPALRFHITSSGYQVAGNIVTWSWRASIADFLPLGVDPEHGTSAALIQGGKIIFYSLASSAEWRATLHAATTPPASLPKTGGDPQRDRLWLIGAGALMLGGLSLVLRHRARVRAIQLK